MKVAVTKTGKSISDALLDDFFKGDENYTGDAQAEEEERSEHDKHWNANMLVMQYSVENIRLKTEIAENQKIIADLVRTVCNTKTELEKLQKVSFKLYERSKKLYDAYKQTQGDKVIEILDELVEEWEEVNNEN